MNASVYNPTSEPGWKTYLKTAAFSLPAIMIWAFSCIFVFPKMKQIWAEVGFRSAFAVSALNISEVIARNSFLVAGAVIATLILLERRSHQWPRYRKTSFGIAAFIVNTAVLLFITVMFVSVLIAVPSAIR